MNSEQCCSWRALGRFWRGMIWSMPKPAYQLLQEFSITRWICRWDDLSRKPLWEGNSCALQPECRGGCGDPSGLSAAPFTFREEPVWAGRANGTSQDSLTVCTARSCTGRFWVRDGGKASCIGTLNQWRKPNENTCWKKICHFYKLFLSCAGQDITWNEMQVYEISEKSGVGKQGSKLSHVVCVLAVFEYPCCLLSMSDTYVIQVWSGCLAGRRHGAASWEVGWHWLGGVGLIPMAVGASRCWRGGLSVKPPSLAGCANAGG